MLAAGAAQLLAAPREPAGSADNSVHPAAASVKPTQELRTTSTHPRAAARALDGVGDDDKTDAALANAAPLAGPATVSAPNKKRFPSFLFSSMRRGLLALSAQPR